MRSLKGGGEAVQGDEEAFNGNRKALKSYGEAFKVGWGGV